MEGAALEGADWPVFGWSDDIRPALRTALAAGRACVLGTLWRVAGSAPRGPGAQMLFDGPHASGYFSGDCIEGDVARHAAEVLASGEPRQLHYGAGSPWIDIRLRCGGALHVFLERVAADSAAARRLLAHADARQPCRWISDGRSQTTEPGEGALVTVAEGPFRLERRFDPPRRIIVSGGDPGSLALAQLAASAQFETVLVRPGGPDSPPPLAGVAYLRGDCARLVEDLGIDRWTAYIGATHEDHHDLAACLAAVRAQAAWVGMIGAKSRADGRRDVLRALGASEAEIARIRFSPGIAGLGKAPWEVATGIMTEVMQALNPAAERT